MKCLILCIFLLISITTNEKTLPVLSYDIHKNTAVSKNVSQYLSFLKALGKRESGNDYLNDKNMPYWGYYQIGPLVRRTLRINKSWEDFKNDSTYQDYVMYKNLKYNEDRIGESYIDFFLGKEINGVIVTYSGILAASHIGGGGGVRKYLYTNGMYNPTDKLKTSISDYMRLFAGYNFKLDSLDIQDI